MTSFLLHRTEFLGAILGGQRRQALDIVRRAGRSCTDPAEIYVEIFQEALYEVGRLWETNRITVAGEHVATAVTQYVLAQMYFEREIPQPVRGNAVIAGVQGELHAVGAHIVADALEHDGWNVRLLGSDVPSSGILHIVEQHEAAVLGVSATMRTNVPAAARLIAEVKRHFGPAVRVVVGGGAFRSSPLMAEQIGADGFAGDVRSALVMMRQMSRQPGAN